ncbi:hypothetical protein [Bacillus sp. FSL K6-3431]|uniref:hypothetical protein n=1 Tax=Bacillus sp. FSL K6-3431 TaxID=2921500 RepID=UPI0030F6E9E9
MTVLSNDVFKKNFIEYLEYKDLNEVASIMKSCDFILTDTGQFTYSIWNQTSLELDIRIPLPLMKKVEEFWDEVVKLSKEFYPDDKDHDLLNVIKGVKIMDFTGDETEEEDLSDVSMPGGRVYQNLVAKVHKQHIDSIEKNYILEACYCGQRGYRLAAATMIGCAAERLLIQLCDAYLSYLENGNGSEREITKFKVEVVEAKKAHARLDGFLGKTKNSEDVFKQIGLENSNLHFSFLDIMRQVRNESGHPTGIKISEEDLSTIFGNYQLLIDRVHPVITKLPTFKASNT